MQTVSYQRRHAELRFLSPPHPFHSRLQEKEEHHILADKSTDCGPRRHSFCVDRQHRAGSNPFLSSDIYKEPPLPAASPAVTAEKKKKKESPQQKKQLSG